MDVVCFSFDCSFNEGEDGSSNCKTTETKYSMTTTSTPTTLSPSLTSPTLITTYTPTTQPAPTPTNPTLKTTSTPMTVKTTVTPSSSISTQSKTEPKPSPRQPSTTWTSTQKPPGTTTRVPKPSPGKPSSTPLSSVSTFTSVIVPNTRTTPGSVTTITNSSRLPDPAMPHKGTSHPPGGSADGKSVYIPCSVVFCVIIFVFVCIGMIRRHRKHRRSSEDRQHLHPECDLIFDFPQFQVTDTQTRYVQPSTLSPNVEPVDPMFSDVPSPDDVSDTEENEVERIDLLHFSSSESDDLESTPKIEIDEVIFDASTVCKGQRKHDGSDSGVV